ncbi:MAG: hypothetical protein D6681_05710 [Calditrichaeota bacterium]|nr:MAG: hypothetical protein D6681_05710 [Calditrichota bacterium]
MPWWEHNRHMTVLVDANPSPLWGIYFMRRLRSADITPVYVEGKDVIVLIESFYAYWLKSRGEGRRNPGHEPWIPHSKVSRWGELFRELDNLPPLARR